MAWRGRGVARAARPRPLKRAGTGGKGGKNVKIQTNAPKIGSFGPKIRVFTPKIPLWKLGAPQIWGFGVKNGPKGRRGGSTA